MFPIGFRLMFKKERIIFQKGLLCSRIMVQNYFQKLCSKKAFQREKKSSKRYMNKSYKSASKSKSSLLMTIHIFLSLMSSTEILLLDSLLSQNSFLHVRFSCSCYPILVLSGNDIKAFLPIENYTLCACIYYTFN